jgi:hypothetical protein
MIIVDNMFDPANLDDDGLPLTIRAVFVICPLKKIKLILRAWGIFPRTPRSLGPELVSCRPVKLRVGSWLTVDIDRWLSQSTRRLSAATWTSFAVHRGTAALR